MRKNNASGMNLVKKEFEFMHLNLLNYVSGTRSLTRAARRLFGLLPARITDMVKARFAEARRRKPREVFSWDNYFNFKCLDVFGRRVLSGLAGPRRATVACAFLSALAPVGLQFRTRVILRSPS